MKICSYKYDWNVLQNRYLAIKYIMSNKICNNLILISTLILIYNSNKFNANTLIIEKKKRNIATYLKLEQKI